MYKKERTQKGITLIALVITIIVMLILVGVTISMAVNGGLFEKAGEAVGKTNNALQDEQLLTNTDIIDYYVNRKPAVTALKAYSEELLENGVLKENTKYESGYYTAVIPKGFALTEERTIANGLVITDEVDEDGNSIGNEFVWIPVKDGEFERTGWWKNEPTDKTLDELTEDWDEEDYMKAVVECEGYNTAEEAAKEKEFVDDKGNGDPQAWLDDSYSTWEEFFKNDYGYNFGELSEDYTENKDNDPTGKYEYMVESVQKYGGFYIGRYEAGAQNDEEERVERKNVYSNANGPSNVVVKKGQYPYIYVGWANEEDYTETITYNSKDQGPGAVYLCEDMYKEDEVEEEKYGVTSTLCYGVQWDAALRFIKDKVNVTNSTAWGNYANNRFTFTGEYSTDGGNNWIPATDREKPIANNENEWTTYLLTTGASEKNKAKNIYDLAGNVYEWTMEADSSGYRVPRGGRCSGYGGDDAASSRSIGYPDYCSNYIGFRPALYIK